MVNMLRAKQINELASTRLPRQEASEIDQLVRGGLFLNRADFVRSAIREKLESMRVVNVREDVQSAQVKQEVLEYISQNEKAFASDIAEALSLDLDLVFTAQSELKKEGKVE